MGGVPLSQTKAVPRQRAQVLSTAIQPLSTGCSRSPHPRLVDPLAPKDNLPTVFFDVAAVPPTEPRWKQASCLDARF